MQRMFILRQTCSVPISGVDDRMSGFIVSFFGNTGRKQKKHGEIQALNGSTHFRMLSIFAGDSQAKDRIVNESLATA